MQKVKVKVLKKETIFFDGKLVSNGHWMAEARHVQLSDKALDALVQAGSHFTRDYYGIMRDEGRPNMDKVIPKPGTVKAKVTPVSWTRSDKTLHFIALDNGTIVAIDERFLPLLDLGEVTWTDAGNLAVYVDDEFRAVVMPVIVETGSSEVDWSKRIKKEFGF